MKRFFINTVCVILSALCMLTAACSSATGYAENLNNVAYNEKGTGVYIADNDFLSALSAFSAKIYGISAEDQSGNYVMSPLSAYMAFALLNNVAGEEVKAETEEFFGMTAEQVALTGDLFLSLVNEREAHGKSVSKLDLTNSVWLDDRAEPNANALNRLAEELFCYAYRAPFASDNKNANNAIRRFIKEKTKGLIDKDFDLSPQTLFALINTLYLKDVWTIDGDLDVSNENFYAKNKTLKTDFLTGKYAAGEVVSNQVCDFFYASTYCGYKLKLILPKDGETPESVSTAANLEYVNGYKWAFADENEIGHFTRCIFPAFKVTSDTKMKEVIQSHGYLAQAFSVFANDLVNTEIAVSDVKHTATVNVNKTGVEGAAVTIIETKETAILPEKPYAYHDFKVDRPFVFLLTTSNDVVLFAGKITDPTIKK